MKKLLEMSQLVTDFMGEKSLIHIFKRDKSDPKAYKLLEGIITGKFKDDEEAANDLYSSTPENKSYQMLKSRTREQMLSLLFTMNIEKRMKHSYQKALYSSSRNLIAARLLILKNMKNVGVDYLRTAFYTAVKFDLTDIKLLSARQLRLHDTFTGKGKVMGKYNLIIKETHELLKAEIEMEEAKENLFVLLRNTSAPEKKLKEVVTESYKKASEINKKFSSHTIKVDYFRIAVYYHHIFERHHDVIKVIEQAEKYLQNHPVFINYAVVAEMALQKLDTSLYIRDYKLGKESAEICRSIYNPGYLNWLIFLEYYFLLCLHTENYEEAQKVFNDAVKHPKFSNYSSERLEKWKIFEAYLSYILPESIKRKRFNISRFLNEVPIFSKDKRGYNLSIIIAQIALLIKMGDFDKVMDKFDSLKSYAGRHVNRIRNPRSFYFVKMLLTLVRYDFDPEKTGEISHKFYEKLKASKIKSQGEIETLEVIPYDILWANLLDKLKIHFANHQLPQNV
ncbi:MAG: hypothetical protein ACHQNT_01305 [Bacteroidia bacterium]